MEGGIKLIQPFTIFLTAVILFGGGFYLGRVQGVATVRDEAEKLTNIVETIYPPPPEEMHRMSGEVTERIGAEFTLEFDDPADYLPHLDGSPRERTTRRAVMNAETDVRIFDYTVLDQYGSPSMSAGSADDVTVGAVVRVDTEANIRDAGEFLATSVEVVRQ